jgi:hypothetical protein
MRQPNRTTTLGVSGHSSLSSTVVEDTDIVATTGLPPLHRSRNMRLKTRPSRHQTNMKLVHPNLVVRHLHSPRALTHPTGMVLPHLYSQTATTRTTDLAHTHTTVALVVAAAADVVHGVAAVTLAPLPARQLSCKT